MEAMQTDIAKVISEYVMTCLSSNMCERVPRQMETTRSAPPDATPAVLIERLDRTASFNVDREPHSAVSIEERDTAGGIIVLMAGART